MDMQLAALECADEVDPVAQQIGAVNTLVRQQDGTLKGYNTDWSAAISAIERGLSSDEATSSTSSAESSGAAPPVDLGAEEATTSGKPPLPLCSLVIVTRLCSDASHQRMCYSSAVVPDSTHSFSTG